MYHVLHVVITFAFVVRYPCVAGSLNFLAKHFSYLDPILTALETLLLPIMYHWQTGFSNKILKGSVNIAFYGNL